MVLTSCGNSEIGAHVKNNICCLIFLMHLIRSRAVTNRIFFSPIRPIFLHACTKCSELPSYISTMDRISMLKKNKVFCKGIPVQMNVIIEQLSYIIRGKRSTGQRMFLERVRKTLNRGSSLIETP